MTDPKHTDSGHDERAGLAAEYVLRTLDETEMARAQDLIRSDRAFAAEVARWERRFDPLLDTIPDEVPPFGALDSILLAIGDARSAGPVVEIIQLRRKATVWKWTAGVATAIAASLLAFVLIRPREVGTSPQFVAVLETPDRTPAFIATGDGTRAGLIVRRVGPAPALGRSFELWAITEGKPPQSLGVLACTSVISAEKLIESAGSAPLARIVLAVTEEPEGGSPTGKPSNAPLYTGKLVPTPSL
jgi:anti-sigma-K factor RskA